VRVHLCGVRGSTPTPGAAFDRYGGNTSCLAVCHDGASEPSLVLDAGTGIRRVSALLDGAPFRGTILLTHLHWDHTQGLPFFGAADRPDARVDLFLPVDGGQDPEELLARAMSPPHFPITPAELGGAWQFLGLRPGRFEIEGFGVEVAAVPHKGGLTFGFRIEDGRSTLAYLPDHGPSAAGVAATHSAALALADGVDLLVHDAQHTADELARWAHYGHASADQAVELAVAAGVGRVLLFHHGPGRTDAELDALLRRVRAGAGVPVEAATEGAIVDLG
jgi:phosphoribosyl 1,2-cyclic phosphodiesterase